MEVLDAFDELDELDEFDLELYTGDYSNLTELKHWIVWLTDDYRYAEMFGKVRKKMRSGSVYMVTIPNGLNLFDCGDTSKNAYVQGKLSLSFSKMLAELQITPYEFEELLKDVEDRLKLKRTDPEFKRTAMIFSFTRAKTFRDLLVKRGYDGITTIEIDGEPYDCWGIFDYTKLKIIDEYKL